MAPFAKNQRLASSGDHNAFPGRPAGEVLELSNLVDLNGALPRSAPFAFVRLKALPQFCLRTISPFTGGCYRGPWQMILCYVPVVPSMT